MRIYELVIRGDSIGYFKSRKKAERIGLEVIKEAYVHCDAELLNKIAEDFLSGNGDDDFIYTSAVDMEDEE